MTDLILGCGEKAERDPTRMPPHAEQNAIFSRDGPPVVDAWDGLSRIVVLQPNYSLQWTALTGRR